MELHPTLVGLLIGVIASAFLWILFEELLSLL